MKENSRNMEIYNQCDCSVILTTNLIFQNHKNFVIVNYLDTASHIILREIETSFKKNLKIDRIIFHAGTKYFTGNYGKLKYVLIKYVKGQKFCQPQKLVFRVLYFKKTNKILKKNVMVPLPSLKSFATRRIYSS